MNELERFKAVVHFEKPDYWPLIVPPCGMGWANDVGLKKLYTEGLPEAISDLESWCRYWGQSTFEGGVGSIGVGVPGIKSKKWVEGDFEFIRYETGALKRQFFHKDGVYSMPDFQEFHVRDRASWEKVRELTTPTSKDYGKIDQWRKQFEHRTRPLAIHAGGTWGVVRDFMGPERALLAIYDDPDLVHDMIAHMLRGVEEFLFPVIEALRPEVITLWEDFCYKNGMLISPAAFREFCAPYYRRVAEIGRACGADLLIVDTDGKVNEFLPLLEEVGINGCWPMEQVCGNDLLAYREKHPNLIFAGGIEKEIVNAGNSGQIEPELIPKIPEMLKRGGYFPIFDHVLQPEVDFKALCRCMARLHKICGSSGGEFPRE